MTFDCELTDTFGGEANYSWVRRATIEVNDPSATRTTIVRAAKRALGMTGQRCDVCEVGETIEMRVRGACMIAFITPRY